MTPLITITLIFLIFYITISSIILFYTLKTLISLNKNISINSAEIDIVTRIEEYLDIKINNEQDKSERSKLWEDFNTPQKTEKQPERKEDGKYNPEEVKGILDGMFGKDI